MSSPALGTAAPFGTPHLDVLDLRHFSAALRPLLRDEAARWQRRLSWDYTDSTELLLEYLDGRVLPGFVALHKGRPIGYTFCVYEGSKAVIGDVYALGEAEGLVNPVCETLLHHLLEMLPHSPGLDRIESQLLMFPSGALAAPFLSRGFRTAERLFMLWRPSSRLATGNTAVAARLPAGLQVVPWQPSFYEAAADLIHASYQDHGDSSINDQYRTVAGSQRFLHNIIRFPGCGIFTPDNSWALRDARNGRLQAIVLTSRVQSGVGHITQLCVAPGLRGSGLGRLLLERCASELQHRGGHALSLTVTAANTAAKRLYDDLGFETMHRFDAMIWDVH